MLTRGGGGVNQMLTIADKGGCGSEKFSTKGFYVNKNVTNKILLLIILFVFF